ncbi:hypothetical protein PIB30_034447 [Stylosanthes scabra]|uniref:CCHC-type domain-containing protein n=1 Tax=Stylosanthes scabra TaxID=79078 RepID=A0ABU6TDV0_9FABA|nr:hypothetical protein [Stylosanthes scabra]
MHRNGGYTVEDFVHKSLIMEVVRATYNFMIHPVPSQEYWNLIGCEEIDPPPIVQLVGHKCGEKGHYYKTCKGAPRDPNWKTKSRKTKKVNTQVATEREATDGQSEHLIDGAVALVLISQNPSNNAPNAQKTPMDPVEKARKSKKKKPKMTTMQQHEEMTLFQIAPTPPNAAPSQEPSDKCVGSL